MVPFFGDEGGVNQAIVKTLRSTVDKRKSFSISWRFMSTCGAVHVDDVSDFLSGVTYLGQVPLRPIFFSI